MMTAETQSLEIPAATVTAAAGGGLAGGSLLVATSENFSSKRQRRPSVRLGDIGGEQHFDSTPTITTTAAAAAANPRKNKHHSKDFNHRLYHHHHHLTGNLNNSSPKSLKSRPLLNSNIVSATGVENIARDFNETLGVDVVGAGVRNELSLDSVAVGSWKPSNLKSKRGLSGLKRVRSNWGGVGGGGGGSNVDEIGDDVRDCDHDGSQSPLNDQFDRGDGNDRDHLFHGERREIRARDRVELSVPSGTSGDRNNGHSGQHGCFEDGVKVWLKGLGLGRYAPVFEVHEVDDEVLPMLTLEDLKDMGINAVGPRRKMFCAIQKLGQEFS